MDKMPQFIIVESATEVAHFRRHLPVVDGVGGDELLKEVLEGLSEAMWDWPMRQQHIEGFIFETVRFSTYVDRYPSFALILSKAIDQLAKAINRAVETHRITVCGIFPYRYHQMLGNNIVMAFYPD